MTSTIYWTVTHDDPRTAYINQKIELRIRFENDEWLTIKNENPVPEEDANLSKIGRRYFIPQIPHKFVSLDNPVIKPGLKKNFPRGYEDPVQLHIERIISKFFEVRLNYLIALLALMKHQGKPDQAKREKIEREQRMILQYLAGIYREKSGVGNYSIENCRKINRLIRRAVSKGMKIAREKRVGFYIIVRRAVKVIKNCVQIGLPEIEIEVETLSDEGSGGMSTLRYDSVKEPNHSG